MTLAAFIYDERLSQHVLRLSHPMRPIRLKLAYELLDAYGVFGSADAVLRSPREATVGELQLIHTASYVDAVQRLSCGDTSVNALSYNFAAEGDNPPYTGMYEAAVLVAGASLTAMELVLEERLPTALSIAGGLHHALPDRTSGFCIFNDPAIIIAGMVRRGLRVCYLDIDAHHGDGVQSAFYHTDRVLTISTHEGGRWLFPGTGEVGELGAGAGRGYSVNLPLAPYTDDTCYRWAFDRVVPPLVERFAPDVLVTQLGVDAHEVDPLSHLKLTTRSYEHVAQWARGVCRPWIALGGGGYHLPTVARVWALEYAIMLGVDLPDALPASFAVRYGIAALRDAALSETPQAHRSFVRQYIEKTVIAIEREIFPIHGIHPNYGL